MNHQDWNQIEAHLRSWTLRAPSLTLRTRLFPPAAIRPQTAPGDFRHPMAAWLIGAAACWLFSLALVDTPAPDALALHSRTPARVLVAAALSNQFYAAYLPADHSLWNVSRPTRLRWTNSDAWPSSTAFGPGTGTNLQ